MILHDRGIVFELDICRTKYFQNKFVILLLFHFLAHFSKRSGKHALELGVYFEFIEIISWTSGFKVTSCKLSYKFEVECLKSNCKL